MILHGRQCLCIKIISFILSLLGLPLSQPRSEEHTSELQSQTLISYAVFCLKVWTRKMVISKRRQWDTPRLASVKTKMPSKEKGRDWNGWPVSGMLKKNEMNLMHGHFLSCKIMHYITFAYCIKHVSFCSSKTGMLSLALDKSFRKTFKEKEDNSKRSEFLKDSSQLSQNSVKLAAKRKSRWRWKS